MKLIYKELELKAQEDERLRLYIAQETERLKQHAIRERELEAQEADRLKQHELAFVLEKFKAVEARKARNAEREIHEAEVNAEAERREAEERCERYRQEQRECEYELQAHTTTCKRHGKD